MRARFWGTRGSCPSPGPATIRYGGNTPCVELRLGDHEVVIIDAGTGIRELGRSLAARQNGSPIEADVYLTHAHWDHVQGLPFFSPAFREGNRFTIWSADDIAGTIAEVLREQMTESAFPVSFSALGSVVKVQGFREAREGAGYRVEVMQARHPGGACGYRFYRHGTPLGGLAYFSDNELHPSAPLALPERWYAELVEFVRGARVLVHDATYTPAEYRSHAGWGHSTHEEALALALAAGVDTLVLFHHHPERTDDDIDAVVAECRATVARVGGTLQVFAAAEGMELEV